MAKYTLNMRILPGQMVINGSLYPRLPYAIPPGFRPRGPHTMPGSHCGMHLAGA